jgi:cytochrome b6-f complex iron-sulfur subunit
MPTPLSTTNPLKRLLCLSMSPPPEDPGCVSIRGDAVTIDLSRAGVLGSPGGALRLDDERLPDRVLVVHGVDGVFRAFRNRCACGGFRVDPVPGEEKIRCCTLMQSTYDYAGKRLSGSARKDLDVLPVTGESGRLEIDVATLRDRPAPHLRKEETPG